LKKPQVFDVKWTDVRREKMRLPISALIMLDWLYKYDFHRKLTASAPAKAKTCR